ncbi:recombinase family protein [Flavobacterium chilense]|uniref:recombinase family protein n=1 Tax=Flavobacterium chilense TaxID=946677 RepID=UPI001FD72FCF|nr:recombinase family protein [Flavobacterium chilense]
MTAKKVYFICIHHINNLALLCSTKQDTIMQCRYIRISSGTQNTIRQEKQKSNEKVYIDVISGAVAFNERPQASELVKDIEAGLVTTLNVESIDRIGRDAYNIQTVINYLNSKGVNLKVDNLGIESFVNGKPNPIFKMITDVLANVSELTRNNIKEAQAQGIKIAVAQGKFKGRVKGSGASDSEVLEKYKVVVKTLNNHSDLSLRKVASISNVSLATVQKVKRILDNQ